VIRENATLFKTKGLQDMGVRGMVAVLTLCRAQFFFASSLNRKKYKIIWAE